MVEIYKALGDSTRLRILSLVMEHTLCVCEIESALGLTQSNASRHLSVLRNSGIVAAEKHAQWAYYTVNERFKTQYPELFAHLSRTLSQQDDYTSDMERYLQIKEKGLCALPPQDARPFNEGEKT